MHNNDSEEYPNVALQEEVQTKVRRLKLPIHLFNYNYN